MKDEVENIINSLNSKIKNLETEYNSKKQTEQDYQERLNSFSNTSNEAYRDLVNLLSQVQNEMEQLLNHISKLGLEMDDINKIVPAIEALENGISSNLYSLVLELNTEMNAENVQVKNVQEVAEEIYQTLLTNNVSANDHKLSEYTEFKENLRKYEAVMNAKDLIDKEIRNLYAYTQNSIQTNDIEEDEDSEEISDGADTGEWNSYWQDRMNNLKEIIQYLQKGGLDSKVSTELIESISERERLYLSDLNDLERAFGLLLGEIHQYKGLLIFSFCFAFGLDLFAVFMSFLLYLIKEPEEASKQ